MAKQESKPETNDFDVAQRRGSSSLVGELWFFLITNKKWWLIPILLVLLLAGALVLVSGSGAAPFIYTLF